MLRLKLYYHAKPFLPWSLRMAVRRYFAHKKRLRHQSVWPIDSSAGEKPSTWTGWPDGKQFAFLLSHDVETQLGYDILDQLLAIEESHGFRSVINFIPEGQYRVSADRIRNLKERGFEVGVHGLYHDGKLYNSKQRFKLRAKKINTYLKSWGVTGFRSPLMHHNLDWLHQLEIAYDSSTFDTDPFEPQPEGLGTVFPKWIPNPEGRNNAAEQSHLLNTASSNQIEHNQSQTLHSSTSDAQAIPHSTFHIPHCNSTTPNGYVELPYTLPQDSTLFLLLSEKTNQIWKDKTAWLAERGGMAFVNTHPDYIDFNGDGSNSQYPASHYENFLTHVKETYAAQYWHATPGEVASHFVRGLRTED